MSSFILSCCSTTDLSPAWLKQRDIEYVCFNFELGGIWYKDDFGISVSPSELYGRMLAGESAKTSQVSTGDYLAFFETALAEGKDILHVTLSSGISNTFNSARLAAEQLKEKYPDRTIHVVDSLCASAGYGLFMERLALLRDEGMDVDTLAQWARHHRLEVNHLFFSSDLTFFVRGGRVSPVAGAVGSMLKICPLLHVATDGSLQVKEKVRTKSRTKRRMLDKMAELVRDGNQYDGPVYISHSECLEDAQDIASVIEETYSNLRDHEVHLFPVGATIGCHTGPGTVALFFWGTPERW